MILITLLRMTGKTLRPEMLQQKLNPISSQTTIPEVKLTKEKLNITDNQLTVKLPNILSQSPNVSGKK